MLHKPYYPVTLTIDGDEVKLRIKRMTDDEFADFSEQHTRVMTPTIAKVTARASAGREQERDGQGHYRLSFESLCMERLETMEQEEREAFMGAVKKDEAEARTFIKYAFETFLTVESGVTEETADGTQVSVTKGRISCACSARASRTCCSTSCWRYAERTPWTPAKKKSRRRRPLRALDSVSVRRLELGGDGGQLPQVPRPGPLCRPRVRRRGRRADCLDLRRPRRHAVPGP